MGLINYGLYEDLAEQAIIDCDTGNSGCSGSSMSVALDYLANDGL